MSKVKEEEQIDSDNSADYSDEEEEEELPGNNVVFANTVVDPLTLAESCRLFACKDGSMAVIKYFKADSLSSQELKWTLNLLRRNMRTMYQQSSWGWKPKVKKEEMTEAAACFLLAFIQDKPVAFCNFRFDMDYGQEVVYCYEIQLERQVRSLGLGKHLMTTLETLAKCLHLSKVVLTVFKHNLAAGKFFKSMGYEQDKTSPSADEDKCYEILSKPILPNES